MSALVKQISQVEEQLVAARRAGDRAQIQQLEQRLARMWDARRRSLARTRNDGSWSYVGSAFSRSKAR